MAEKDLTEKALIDLNDVFADIINALAFKGEQVVEPEALEQAKINSVYEGRKKVRGIQRDNAKIWHNACVHLAYFGIENETEQEDDMPLRIIGYDGSAYRDQLFEEKDKNGKRKKNTNPRYPVISFVLHFDYTRRWTKSVTLKDSLADYPRELDIFINDYKVNLVDAAWLTREEIDRFKSDFWFVLDYLYQMRTTGKYIAPAKSLVHPRELINMFSQLTGGKVSASEIILEDEKEEILNMSGLFDGYLEKGIDQGEEKLSRLILLLQKDGREDDISKALSDKEARKELYKEFNIQRSNV